MRANTAMADATPEPDQIPIDDLMRLANSVLANGETLEPASLKEWVGYGWKLLFATTKQRHIFHAGTSSGLVALLRQEFPDSEAAANSLPLVQMVVAPPPELLVAVARQLPVDQQGTWLQRLGVAWDAFAATWNPTDETVVDARHEMLLAVPKPGERYVATIHSHTSTGRGLTRAARMAAARVDRAAPDEENLNDLLFMANASRHEFGLRVVALAKKRGVPHAGLMPEHAQIRWNVGLLRKMCKRLNMQPKEVLLIFRKYLESGYTARDAVPKVKVEPQPPPVAADLVKLMAVVKLDRSLVSEWLRKKVPDKDVRQAFLPKGNVPWTDERLRAMCEAVGLTPDGVADALCAAYPRLAHGMRSAGRH